MILFSCEPSIPICYHKQAKEQNVLEIHAGRRNPKGNLMKKILYTDFVDTESIIEKMLGQKEIRKAITRNNLYRFWGKIAGAKFAQKSRPYSMLGGGVMVIACENGIVAQELMLKKTQLLVKFKPYLESLKLKVTDLRFDPKKWSSEGE